MELIRFLGSVFFGVLLNLAITLLCIGSTFLVRAAVIYFFNFDFMSFIDKVKDKDTSKHQILNEDEEWLKSRGKY